MRTLILDIETVGEKWEDVDERTRHALTRWIDRGSRHEEEKEALIRALKSELGFSPLTGQVVALGLYDYELKEGVVYYEKTGHTSDKQVLFDEFSFKERSEKELLMDFWEGAKMYDTCVTFNGRCFDIPFLMLRSAFYGIRPTCDLISKRYLASQKEMRHVDLLDEFTFYGALRRKPSLHLLCRAFNIMSPKIHGIEGDDIASLYYSGEFETIARYNAGDLRATATLYTKWRETLAPQWFFENIDETRW